MNFNINKIKRFLYNTLLNIALLLVILLVCVSFYLAINLDINGYKVVSLIDPIKIKLLLKFSLVISLITFVLLPFLVVLKVNQRNYLYEIFKGFIVGKEQEENFFLVMFNKNFDVVKYKTNTINSVYNIVNFVEVLDFVDESVKQSLMFCLGSSQSFSVVTRIKINEAEGTYIVKLNILKNYGFFELLQIREGFSEVPLEQNQEDDNTNDFDKYSQKVLDDFPVAIVVTAKGGDVLYCNRMAVNIFSLKKYNNNNLADYIDSIVKNFNGTIEVKVKNTLHKYFMMQNTIAFDDKEIIILTFYPKEVEALEVALPEEEEDNYRLYDNNDININNLPIGVVIINEDNKIVNINNIFRNTFEIKDNIFNKSLNDLLSTSDMDNNLKNLEHGLYTIKIVVDNADRYFNIYVHKINDNTKIIYFMDISDKKELEKQITFSQRLQTIGQIASAVAHDFNNLLTAIMGFTSFLSERYSDDDPSSAELEQIKQNANRAKVMIRQLLTFSRSQELEAVAFDLNSEISNLMSTILRLVGENIQVRFNRGKDIGKIVMDPVQFQQVIINLVVNAKDAMKKGGKLEIATSLINIARPIEAIMTTVPAGNYILITVKDEGEGIARENLRKIFQVHFSTKGEKGNGLGLSTVSKIIRENSGFVDLKSEVGKGTTFYLYFEIPSIEENLKDVGLFEMAEEENHDLTGSETILLVEDEVSVRMVCRRKLVEKGYKVLEADGGEAALEILQNHKNEVNLIISDVVMPGMSGSEFVEEVRKILPSLKVILMSGYSEDVLNGDEHNLENIEFLSKPFTPDVLVTKVKKFLNNNG